ncbi:MAG: hypothetical protein U1D55_19455 [Phycisphaerae bacterium]
MIAGLIYDAIMQLLVRTVRGQGARATDWSGCCRCWARSLDGDRSEITLNAPLELDAALANVSARWDYARGGSIRKRILGHRG